ncbi:hypothetical protein WJX81_002860 [Elliptochloris bilobata]|uniref:NADH dehydrogenase [ubiquinone] iron-sulfur protein 4, mitochondrial n=1 Tax=Elliptochloris bilobata TaxID=381761 RepID=A0AAW1RCM8_9CHLO
MRSLARAAAALAEPLRGAPWRAFSAAEAPPAKRGPSASAEAERAKVLAEQFIPQRHTEEHGVWGEVAVVAELPDDVRRRRALIYPPSRTASQQGNAQSAGGQRAAWKLSFEVKPKWENGLIGWTSSADPIEQSTEAHLLFRTLESAMAFCHRQGWAYEVAEEKAISKQRPKRFLGYGDNFSVKRHGTPVGGLRSEAGATKPIAKELLKKDKK